MSKTSRKKVGFAVVVGAFFLTAATVGLISCTGVPTAEPVNGPPGAGNTPPTLTITAPTADLGLGQGQSFNISWTDTDSDDDAQISFELVNTVTDQVIALVAGLSENDQTGPDSFTVETDLIPEATYNVKGIIDDGVNPPETVFAASAGTTGERVILTILPEGQGQQGIPPRVAVVQPLFDLSVTQDDIVTVVVTPNADGTGTFDADSDVRMWILLDLDLNPTNDDPANPDASQIIILREVSVAAGAGAADVEPFLIAIDLSQVPPRENGAPYFIRATVDDSANPRVHSYAAGTLSVVRQVAGLVDLSLIGKTLSGARWYGFNPGANFGSTAAGIQDFDADGVEDFVLVAQFGNPRNFGQVGEAYLVYGQNGVRFGGTIAANSVAETVSGVIFEAPPVRSDIPGEARTDGIVDVNFLPDMTGDGRPEIMFGLTHVHGAYDSTDFDPSDDDPDDEDTETVVLLIQNGRVTITVDDGDPEVISSDYDGVSDTTIVSTSPETLFGSSGELVWQAPPDLVGTRQFTLIKFSDVLEVIPDDPFNINIVDLTAQLQMRVFDTGGSGVLHEVIIDFDEATTYGTFSGGGDPEPGVDYRVVPLSDVGGEARAVIELQVDTLVQDLLEGNLAGSDDELRFIVVPNVEALEAAKVRSSEYANQPDRPALEITYERPASVVQVNCFPDMIVNNFSDPDNEDNSVASIADTQLYAGGMAVIVNSTNRDNDPVVTAAPRLASTSISLELTGQRNPTSGIGAEFGNISVFADNSTAGDDIGNDPDEPNRISGVRIIAGPYDFIGLDDPREGLFGQTVGGIGDIDNDQLEEIIISAPRNEQYLQDIRDEYAASGGFLCDPQFQGNPGLTHLCSTMFIGSIVILPGFNYNSLIWRDIRDATGTSTVPTLDHHRSPGFGQCSDPPRSRGQEVPLATLEVFAEEPDDFLGGAGSAGDFNLDGLGDIVAGAPGNDRGTLTGTGAVYILYNRSVQADFVLADADDPLRRSPMMRLRGAKTGDQLGWKQTSGRDVNGDRITDVFFSSPRADYEVTRTTCAGDFDNNGSVNQSDLRFQSFELCIQQFANDLFLLDDCKVFDYDNDNDIDDDDRCVFCCLSNDCSPDADCVFGKSSGNCCKDVVDNGIVGVIFGGRFLDGDRDISQLATSDLPGAIFHGGKAGDRAGMDIASAGDFNQDGFGDLLIAVPGETRLDDASRTRVGVVYLVFGGTHLENEIWNLSDPIEGVGSDALPGIIFISPYVAGRPNEAAPLSVAGLGDINNDGFDDIAIGNPRADFIDLTFPQGPDAPGSDAAAGRRRDAGDAHVIYGNNFGSNRGAP